MSRTLKYDIPGRDFRICGHAGGGPWGLDDWRAIFAPDIREPAPFVVDIGFGRGELLIDLATRDPKQAHIGIERSFKRTLKMARRLARLGIDNVRLLETRAEDAMALHFPPGSIACAWINFPDPWPKDRHARRRLVQAPFIHDLTLRLGPEGRLNLATDDPSYAAQMADVLAGEPLLENLNAPDAHRRDVTGRIPTAYELEWQAQGRTCHYFAYRRADAPGTA
jgi:tRNA (guanine-N7-)-methyltransferase